MGRAEYPADHEPGMQVPGPTSCGSCEYYRGDMICGNEYFIRWNGSDKIPAPSPDKYCSDWYEPKETERTKSPHGFPELPKNEGK